MSGPGEVRLVLVSEAQREAVAVGADRLAESLRMIEHLPDSLLGDARRRSETLAALVAAWDAAEHGVAEEAWVVMVAVVEGDDPVAVFASEDAARADAVARRERSNLRHRVVGPFSFRAVEREAEEGE